MLELSVRIGFSLLVVLGLMWLLAKATRRPLGRRTGALAVLARQQVSRHSSVTVVRVADRALVLGVTDTQVTLLMETDLTAVEEEVRAEPTVRRDPVTLDQPELTTPPSGGGRLAGSVLSPKTWSQAMAFLRDRTARR